MPSWKYHSILPNGVSVFGVFDAEDEASLAAYLQSRGMTLVSAQELSLSPMLNTETREQPRMVQLRIGERLREALLTDLPAHEAIRAMADEPLEHPLLMLMPWVIVVAGFVAVVLALLGMVLPESQTVLQVTAALILMLPIMGTMALRGLLVSRPRKLLLQLADRLERGDSNDLLHQGWLAPEVRCVLDAPLDSRTQAASVAELVPELNGMRLQAHRFAAAMLAPVISLSLLLVGLHVMLLTIVPQFKEIFIGFGVELPVITMMLITISGWVGAAGVIGLCTVIAGLMGLIALLYALLILPRGAEFLEPVPFLGLSIRWQIQARIARIMSVLLKNNAPSDTAVSVAAKASGYPAAAADGLEVANCIRKGQPVAGVSRRLSGLPLSLLFRSSSEQTPDRRQQVAHSFQTYAVSLEQASSGNAAVVAVIVEMLVVVTASLFIGFFVIAMFMPLIKLLNDLAVILLPLGGWLR